MAEILSGIESARFYASRGLYPVPAPWGEKGSRTLGWQNLRLKEPELEFYFNGGKQNVGVLLGEPHHLCDVDLDTAEARRAWAELGLETHFVFGRRSNPASHHFFYSTEAVKTKPYDDPLAGDRPKRLIELRGLGAYQLVPPSRHPEGEDYEWADGRGPGTPSTIDAEVLKRAVATTAAAVLASRHFKVGSRHHAVLALAGACARSGWHEDQTEDLVRAICVLIQAKDPEFKSRSDVRDTYRKLDDAKEATGLPTLRNLLDKPILDKLVEWLRLSVIGPPPPKLEPLVTATRGGAAPAPAVEPPRIKRRPPPAQRATDLIGTHQRRPEQLIQECITTPGVTIVCGGNKMGKTIFTVQMLMAVARGIPFLEQFKTLQRPTLLLEWDDKQAKAEVEEYVEKARAAQPGMPFFWTAPAEDDPDPYQLSDPEFLPFLKEEIRNVQAGLVAIDSYSALRGVRGKGGDTVKLDSQDILQLQLAALEMNVALLLLHHDSKSSAALDWASRGAGSYALGAASDAIVYVTRYPDLPEKEGARLVRVRSRRMDGAEFALRYQKESKDYDLILEGPAAREYPEIRKLVRAFPTVPFTAQDARDPLGASLPTVYRLLAKLLEWDVLQKDSASFHWHPKFEYERKLMKAERKDP